ncbi:histidine phosphatase family protein [Plantactinospora soyae]|uniref:Broad specificity phosphatase PhoE n=1 Tax=Plantactinospora soyae TaxID=1544732 RepID=A0A927MAB0_9ACTN|nr:histidine phosphatase family protein [Plantactinospora soyae]MBE1489506.1 broad specificity phosphatase PhoE [Plantactinospora soyae]
MTAGGFLLMRHGETNWPLVNVRRLPGHANDLAPLTSAGVEEVRRRCGELRGIPLRYVVSSPMTRAVQSAAIAAGCLNLPLHVELDLHEWVPDLTFNWTDPSQVDRPLTALWAGIEPVDFDGPPYESRHDLAARIRQVLGRHAGDDPVLVLTHAVAIWSVTGRRLDTAAVTWLT